jgi:hypothetical protein
MAIQKPQNNYYGTVHYGDVVSGNKINTEGGDYINGDKNIYPPPFNDADSLRHMGYTPGKPRKWRCVEGGRYAREGD